MSKKTIKQFKQVALDTWVVLDFFNNLGGMISWSIQVFKSASIFREK